MLVIHKKKNHTGVVTKTKTDGNFYIKWDLNHHVLDRWYGKSSLWYLDFKTLSYKAEFEDLLK